MNNCIYKYYYKTQNNYSHNRPYNSNNKSQYNLYIYLYIYPNRCLHNYSHILPRMCASKS